MRHAWKQVKLILNIQFRKNNYLYIRREVSYEEGNEFAKKYNLFFMEVSAKNGYNIEEV